MKEQLKPMDVYATRLVSFDIAAYCRGHKFSPQAVTLARALKTYSEAKEHLALAEEKLESAMNAINAASAAVREKMEADSHA